MVSHDIAQYDTSRKRVDHADPSSEPVHPHYAAPPPSKEVAGEPRLLHALTVATWLGRLIDPLIHHEPRLQPRSDR